MMPTPPAPRGVQTRALVASLIGSSIEWYDYFLYGTVASLVFAKRFFPSSDARTGLLLAYASFGIPFFFRPLGGVVFSHLGDRVGRKVSLVLTLTLMGTATVLIGCLPDHASIGVGAPILLVVLRLIQGLGIGGEWGGALLLAVEHAGPRNRGLYGSVPQMGVTVGLLLGTIAISLVSRLPEAAFLAWGWRLPFLASAVLVIVGLWIRKGIDETPAFRAARARGEVAKVPLVETLRHHKRAVLLAIGLKVVETAPFYVFSTFIISYATTQVGLDKVTALNAVTAGTLVCCGTIPLMGRLADRVGRRPLYIGGTVAIMLFAVPYFALVGLRSPVMLTLATVVALGVLWAPVTAVLGTLYSEIFATNVRYTGVTLGYQIGAALAGGTAPLVATTLLAAFDDSWVPVALYVMLAGAVSLGCILVTRETRGADLAGTGAEAPRAAAPAPRAESGEPR
ncbi:MAG TPA: MFS transporter [Polyangia bacterium]|jgi:metabolite-proton symporter